MLVALLRVFGTSSLFAMIFVLAPSSWMHDIHSALGMGELPDAPVVWYLARSVSAMYAVLGGLFWTLSFDPVRYRPVLRYLGAAVLAFGVSLFGIDWAAGMPTFWTFWEGPVVTAFGVTLSVLVGRIEENPTVSSDRVATTGG
jgi:hypothetical protein